MNTTFCQLQIPLPEGMQHITVVQYDIKTFQPEDLMILPHRAALQRAIPVRCAEHLAGRLAARQALRLLGVTAPFPAIGCHRQPLWPAGIIGSISHTRQWALAAVAKSFSGMAGLGIDLEPQLSSQQAHEIADTVMQGEEKEMASNSGLPFEQVVTLVFSAKESLFKALFAHVGDWFDFSAAVITDISLNDQRFTLRLAQDLTPELPAGMAFSGQWRDFHGDMMTLLRFAF